MNLLLLSNSTMPGHPYLDWPKELIDRFLEHNRNVLFIPFAAVSLSYDSYEQAVANALSPLGIKISSIHHQSDPVAAINQAEAIAVGGGNTFHLLHELYRLGLMEPIRARVKSGVPYIGWSAGSNVACQTIKTTNDMPIIMPPSLDALALVHFQINPHYTERTLEGHGGESRLDRLLEYSAINDAPVVCLPEACAIRVSDDHLRLLSAEPVKLIRKGGAISSLQHGNIKI